MTPRLCGHYGDFLMGYPYIVKHRIDTLTKVQGVKINKPNWLKLL